MKAGNWKAKVSTLFALLVMLTALGSLSCDRFKDPPPPTFEVVIRVDSDPGVPLAGAVVTRNQKDVAPTDSSGRAKLTITGSEGDTHDYFVRCPADYQSPIKPISVVLRRLTDKSRPPEYTTSCPPNVRLIVVAVRAEGGPNLPITHLGQRIINTDASGAAHVLMRMRPGDQFELGIDTSEKGYERLRPQNPTSPLFQVKGKDEIQLFEVKFTLEKGKAPPRAVRAAGPRRLGT
jgi:hypothetical protein